MFTEDRKGVAAPARYVSFVWEYMKVNMAMEMEYRAAFLARMFGMIVNDCMWLCFWVMYFTRFPVGKDGRRMM